MDSVLEQPTNSPSQKIKGYFSWLRFKFTTRDGLLGDYDYKYLFTPSYPFHDFICRLRGIEVVVRDQPFFGLNEEVPVLLGMILGFQHALAMLAGVITPPMMIASAANLDSILTNYLVSASLITSGILSAVQITRFHIPKTNYYIGSGVLSIVGTSFAVLGIVDKSVPLMYSTGYCPGGANSKEACPDGYGALLGTAACCALLEMLLSFTPPHILQKIFPKQVTGPVVLTIAVPLIQSGFEDWVGGSGCVGAICPSEGAPQAAPWGSAKFIGLGFLVYTTIILCEKYGPPILKSCAVIVGLLVGCIVAAACGYFQHDMIDVAPAATFLWKHTFRLRVYGPAVLPFLVMFIVLAQECIGDITATSDVSRLEVEGEAYESRIQGAVLSDGIGGILSSLFTVTPMSTFAQNNGVISLTKCASRQAGYWTCFYMLIMGIFAKFGAAIVQIPKPVLGGMTTFLFTTVAVAGIKIISEIPFTRRDRFVLTGALLPGFGSILVSDWFDYVFTYKGNNHALEGFFNAIILIMETSFTVCGLTAIILNLLIPQELDEELLDDIEVQQENLSVLEGRKSPLVGPVMSGKEIEAFELSSEQRTSDP
ncbi:(ZYRO0E02772g) [Zygosaccharomyces parabailii]|nr:(ZYRO0E02772g) [Zygosaccharomyces parabailii]CDH16583.1 related to uric acid-xanthine permease [Zygosaccharomyces bailii ISA1307]